MSATTPPASALSTTSSKRPASPQGDEGDARTAKKLKDTDGAAVNGNGSGNGGGGDVVMADSQDATDAPASTSASTAAADGSISAPPKPAESQNISMRCLIVTQDASVIIGRGGVHVNEIREKSSARVTVSESIPGNPERILNVSGQLDAVAKAFGLIVRRINDEPFDVASLPGSKAVTIKFIIPHSRMGSVIGKGGSKIKEIQEASGARLNASEAMLPNSNERVLSVSGVADAIHIAVYYIGTILVEWAERNPGGSSSSSAGQYRQQGGRGGPGGGDGYRGGGDGYRGGPGGGGGFGGPPGGAGAHTQQIFIPNSLVGAIIGKGGQKINEIRSQSGCQIRVTDPGTPAQPGQPVNPDERLVTITGQPGNINTAVQMLYSRLEAEKQKSMMGGV